MGSRRLRQLAQGMKADQDAFEELVQRVDAVLYEIRSEFEDIVIPDLATLLNIFEAAFEGFTVALFNGKPKDIGRLIPGPFTVTPTQMSPEEGGMHVAAIVLGNHYRHNAAYNIWAIVSPNREITIFYKRA